MAYQSLPRLTAGILFFFIYIYTDALVGAWSNFTRNTETKLTSRTCTTGCTLMIAAAAAAAAAAAGDPQPLYDILPDARARVLC